MRNPKQQIFGIPVADEVEETSAARSAALQKPKFVSTYRTRTRTVVILTYWGQWTIARLAIAAFAFMIIFNLIRFTKDCVFDYSTQGACANRIDWAAMNRRDAAIRQLQREQVRNDPEQSPVWTQIPEREFYSVHEWAEVVTDSNLRDAPSLQSTIIGVVRTSERVEVVTITNGWAEVVNKSKTGWVSWSALELDNPDDNSTTSKINSTTSNLDLPVTNPSDSIGPAAADASKD
jgi:hypothetical protein